MHVNRLFISILTDFVTSHKIAFYSKLYDIDLLENVTHDRTYITLYVHEFLLSLHPHCFLDKKAPRTTFIRVDKWVIYHTDTTKQINVIRHFFTTILGGE